ncbi:flavin-dependent oxidoreductase [Gilvimarinus sp. F26214L]|uniref:flavin-dependent oxidoreductase n=1 Tax=Gilvimarinus sp. DZF01 TaxID=3461371 RepID=UPI004045D14F
MNKPVIIAGAGPVGLTLALLLHRQGRAVRIFEAVEELRPLGVGINLLPHSTRVLYDLGLGPQLDAIGIRTSALHYYNKFGQQIWAEPRGLNAGYRYPQYSVHRGRLQMMLLDATRDQLGGDCIVTGHALTAWDDTANGVQAHFINQAGATITVEGACLVATDGIKSTARKILYPNEGAPIYGGRILWRGVSEGEAFLDGSTMFMAGHQDCKFVAYPIRPALDGKPALLNWIAELSEPEFEQDEQDWNREVSIDVFKDPFQSWDFGWVNVPEIIESCQHVYEFPLADRDPLPRWSFGNMTLAGDAAHPMYPIGSNGASQGILDAEKLAAELNTAPDLQSAFAAYEDERRPATGKIVLLNRQNGPEQVMQMAEERAPEGFAHIEDVIPREELEAVAARYKQTAGFDLDAVNRERTGVNPIEVEVSSEF